MDASHAAAQSPLHITTQRLHVTSEDNFWTIMLQVLIVHYTCFSTRGSTLRVQTSCMTRARLKLLISCAADATIRLTNPACHVGASSSH